MDLSEKKVLITGADGFIGSHLTDYLVNRTKKVRALSYYNSFNSWGWLDSSDSKNHIEIISGDIRDPHFCRTLVKDIDVVFNLAALIAIPYSYVAPQSYVATNISGTLNMVQACLEEGCELFLQTSTSEVYGTAQYVPIDELHPLQPQSPYSASKIGADQIALSYFNSFELPVTIMRPFNNYGPRQSARAIIPTIITQVLAGKKNIKLGDLSPTRDFVYVKDTIEAMTSIAETDNLGGEVINIGTNNEISVGDLVTLIANLMDTEIEVIQDEQRIRPANSEVFRLKCDNKKLLDRTNFEPTFGLKKGLIETIEWYSNKENLSKFKTDIYNV
ncbi:MAG: 4,6-dehydratase LegB [Balneolaceae bacterium]